MYLSVILSGKFPRSSAHAYITESGLLGLPLQEPSVSALQYNSHCEEKEMILKEMVLLEDLHRYMYHVYRILLFLPALPALRLTLLSSQPALSPLYLVFPASLPDPQNYF